MSTYSLEDRIQWHRAYADMMRWLEEFELKHMEFIRCIKSFDAMATAWDAVSAKHSNVTSTSTKKGYDTFAHRQANTYRRLHDEAERLFKTNAESSLYNSRDDLIAAIQSLRKRGSPL